ncbi:unnamed protein product [Phytophthora fragariaefolia]|uniref:Unnamed protein product n=1 Tax=Phytophthora fragariaefolia TaxID=1490495 RepID=A0A9W6XXN9_9STRA|nr:unnamed protein product [Phytophthora fragariaefolia]
MSSASDLSAFEHSVEPATGEVLFSGKKWTYIQDSSSTSGQYSGQIQLNLSSISSQAAFVNWSEAVIQLPVKLQILNGSGSSITSAAAATIDQLVPKAGAWQFIDSVSVVIDGVTVQTNQIHENVNAIFKALTEWSLQDAQKYGPTSTFALDSYDPPATNCPQGLDNLPTAQFMQATANLGEFGLANTYSNSGARERSLFTSINTSANSLAYDVAGSVANAQAVAKPLVYVAPAGGVAVGAPFYVAHYIATIRLADICDFFKKTPMSKNAKGFIYLNYNSSQTSITTGGSPGVVSAGNIASIATNMRFGNTCPILYNVASATTTAAMSNSGVLTATGLTVPGNSTLTVTADIDGTLTSGTSLSPSQSFCRLLVPTYMPNPTADHALVQKKSFRYFERMTNKFTVGANQAFTFTLTNGIANPKKLFLQPVITNPTAASTVSDTINPFRSPFSTVPATTSPFVGLKSLQCTVGNIPIWNNPVSFGYDLFVQEMQASGVDGGLDDDSKECLLSQRQWESLYRFVAVDIGRRLPSEDGASKSIILSGTNNSNYAITVYYHIWRDAVATTDTAMGTVSQGATQI